MFGCGAPSVRRRLASRIDGPAGSFGAAPRRTPRVVLRFLASVAIITGVVWLVALLGAAPEEANDEPRAQSHRPHEADITRPLADEPLPGWTPPPEPTPAGAAPAPDPSPAPGPAAQPPPEGGLLGGLFGG